MRFASASKRELKRVLEYVRANRDDAPLPKKLLKNPQYECIGGFFPGLTATPFLDLECSGAPWAGLAEAYPAIRREMDALLQLDMDGKPLQLLTPDGRPMVYRAEASLQPEFEDFRDSFQGSLAAGGADGRPQVGSRRAADGPGGAVDALGRGRGGRSGARGREPRGRARRRPPPDASRARGAEGARAQVMWAALGVTSCMHFQNVLLMPILDALRFPGETRTRQNQICLPGSISGLNASTWAAPGPDYFRFIHSPAAGRTGSPRIRIKHLEGQLLGCLRVLLLRSLQGS